MDTFIYIRLKTVALSVDEEKYRVSKVVLSLAMVELCTFLADSAAGSIAGELLAAWTHVNIHIRNSVFGFPVSSVNCSVCR
jgi:hypothetical protein